MTGLEGLGFRASSLELSGFRASGFEELKLLGLGFRLYMFTRMVSEVSDFPHDSLALDGDGVAS